MQADQLYESPFTDFSPKGVVGVFSPAGGPVLDLRPRPMKVGSPLFAFFAKGTMPPAAPILTLLAWHATDSILPALANDARTEHPPFENGKEKRGVKGWATRQTKCREGRDVHKLRVIGTLGGRSVSSQFFLLIVVNPTVCIAARSFVRATIVQEKAISCIVDGLSAKRHRAGRLVRRSYPNLVVHGTANPLFAAEIICYFLCVKTALYGRIVFGAAAVAGSRCKHPQGQTGPRDSGRLAWLRTAKTGIG